MRRRLTTGDALTILALLAFTLGYLWFCRGSNLTEDDYRDGGLVVLALVLGPPIWAGWLVTRIVNRDPWK